MNANLENLLTQVATSISNQSDMSKQEKHNLLAQLEEVSKRNAEHIELCRRFNINGSLSDFTEYLMTRVLAAEHALHQFRSGMRKK